MINRDPYYLVEPLHEIWTAFFEAMNKIGAPVFLTETVRSNERQGVLYSRGRTRPGPVVTYAKAGQSAHNPNDNGLARAFDFAFVGSEPWSEDHPWELAGELLKWLGAKWGGDWKSRDRPHAYLDEDQTTA